MTRTPLRVIAAVLLAAGLSSSASAQGPVAAACADDIPKFCAGLQHGQGAVRTCLESNKDKVSADCKTALDTHGPGMGGTGGGTPPKQ